MSWLLKCIEEQEHGHHSYDHSKEHTQEDLSGKVCFSEKDTVQEVLPQENNHCIDHCCNPAASFSHPIGTEASAVKKSQ